VREVECQFRTFRGTVHTVLVSAEIVEVNHEQHMLGFFADITERKRVENELVRTLAREKELGQLRSNFVSMVSHEFRRLPKEEIIKTQIKTLAFMAAFNSPAFAQELPTTGPVETRLGKLELTDGYPTEATAKKLYDDIDFQRACQAYIWALPAVGLL
jgi:hypothetical protein